MASSDDPLLRLQRTAYMTPRRRSPSIVDAVDRPREQTTPFSPESIYPTPPEASPWQACHQTGSATISRPAPLKLLGGGGELNAVPQTPQRRVDVGIHSSFTPFHDIKQDIDKLIGELPIGLEDLVKSKEETVVERSQIRNGKHLSLFLYSPSKKKPLEPTGEDVFGSGEGFELIGEETLALPCVNSAPTDLEHQQQPLNRSLLSKASRVFKKTIKFIVPRGLNRLSRGNTSCEVRLEGEAEAKAEAKEEAPRPIQLPFKRKARSIPMRNSPPGCCHHSQQQTLATSRASNSILLLPIMSNNSISSPPQRRRRQGQQQQQPPQPQQQPKSSIRRKPVPKVPPPKYPAAATPPHHVATTIRGRRRSTILRIHAVPSYIVHQDDFCHPHPPHHPHRFSPPESKSSSSSSNRIQSLHASIYDFDIDVMMPDHHQEEKQQQQQKAQKGQKIHAQIPLSQTSLYIQAAASLCIMAIAAGADFLVEDDSSYGYYCGVGRKMGSWRRRVGWCKISERRR